MSESPKKFYLTTPIYYVNARPHIGHAYTTIVADVIARRHRLLGDDTYFLTGTDEHGQKIERSAAAANIPPQQFTDQVAAQFKGLWDRMGITYDNFIRTTEPRHIAGAQRLFTELYNRGHIYLSTYTGAYCVSDEAFVDLPVGTPCPDCGRILEEVTEENFFFRLSAFQGQLIDLIESNTLAIQPEVRRNEVLSFLRGDLRSVNAQFNEQNASGTVVDRAGNPWRISKEDEQDGLYGVWRTSLKWGLDHGLVRKTSQSGKDDGYYTPGALKDLSVSRSSFSWGIPVPEPAASQAKDKHIIYVWLDALINYMSAVGYGSDAPEDIAKFQKYWPADLHLVGKEIIRFHCVYWPAFLMGLSSHWKPDPSGDQNKGELVLESDHTKFVPEAITAHGWLLFEESKMSKSRGNIVRTETILNAFGTLKPKPIDLPGAVLSDEYWKHQQDLFASDVLRYFLLREIPFGQDGSFSFDALVQRYNSDLANGYGNLVSRTLSMIAAYNSGSIPGESHNDWDEKLWLEHAYTKSSGITQWSSPDEPISSEAFSPNTMYTVIEHALRARDLLSAKFGNIGFQAQLAEVSLAIRTVDGFITSAAPWKIAKQSGVSGPWLQEILYTAAESIRFITVLLYPFMPYTTTAVWQQLGLDPADLAPGTQHLATLLQWGGLKPGTKLGPLSPIFPRADKSIIQQMTDMELNMDHRNITAHADAKTSATTEFTEASLASATAPAPSKFVDEKTTHTAVITEDPTHPAAPPRTSALTEENPGTQVAASASITTERPDTPSHTEAPASGIFASTPQIAIDDFIKIDLRVAQIIVAERIPKADKLLRLEVDLGTEKRQILSGIAEWYTPEELLGKKIVVIANLAPRKMRGLESHGMLLAASAGENGKPILATFGEDIALGSRLK